MWYIFPITTSLLISAAGAAMAADACIDLCSNEFYQSATAESIQQKIGEGVDVNALDGEQKSALHWVAGAKPEVIIALLAAGAEVNAKDYLERAPLLFVAASGSVENINLLLDAGADINAKTANDWTALHGAAKFNTAESVIVLLEAGADPTAKTEMGETPFALSPNNQKLAETEALKLLEERQ